MSYDRCKDHNLMRCPICAPKMQTGQAAKAPTKTAVPAFNPEDLLDAPTGAPSAPVKAVPEGQDKQSLEAAARLRSNAPVEVNFGDGPEEFTSTAVLVSPPEPELGVAEHLVVLPELAKPVVQANDGSPIVKAAQEYAIAQKQVQVLEKRIETLRLELNGAEAAHLKAVGVAEAKKFMLQELVTP